MTQGLVAHTILLVEDDDDHAELTRRILDGRLAAGTALVHVRDGEQAQDYLFQRGAHAIPRQPASRVAVILVDLHLPRRSGLELLADLKRSAAFRALPAVVLTTSRAEMAAVGDLGYPASSYLLKPLRMCELSRALRGYGAGCLEQCLATPV